jgi:hypothetical protein
VDAGAFGATRPSRCGNRRGPITSEDRHRQVLETVFEHFASDAAGWRLLCDEPSGDPVVAEVQRRGLGRSGSGRK